FYIILAGKISIFILNKDRDGGNDGEEKDAFGAIGTLNKDGVLDRSKLGNFVTSLGTGFPFGEVALVSDDAIRTATIVAEEDTDLLVVDRALYNRAVRDVLAAEFEEKQAFIKTNDLFSSWTPKYKKQLTMAMYKEIYCYDSVLVKQGDQVNNIYFIISGQVEIRADTSQHPTQLIKQKRHKKQHETENVQNIPPSLKKKESTIRKHKMCFLGMNESLGEVEVLMDMDTYMTTAVCTEKTEVIVLEMKHYERLFVKKHQRTIDAMRRRLEVKLNTKTSVLKEYDAIPLLKLLQLKLNLLHNPPQTPEDKKKRNETEKSRLRLQQHRKDRQEARKNNHFNAHLHSIRLPQSLLMAAQIAIENEAGNDPHFDLPEISLPPPSTRIEVAKRPQNSEIDVVASQNRAELEIIPDPKGDGDKINENGDIVKEKAQENVDLLPESLLRSFRRIQSATKSTSSRSVDHDQKNGTVEIKHEHRIRSLPSSPRLRIERCKTETKLQRLETKVEEWLKKDNPKASAHVSKLRRIQLEEMETPPKPGNKIVVRRRSRGVRNDKTTHTGIGSSEFTGSA
ncbi:KAPR-like protein, partial [Mya arenaria]